jgi:hypothetical protein
MAKKTKKSKVVKKAAKKAVRKMAKKFETKVDRSNTSANFPFSS